MSTWRDEQSITDTGPGGGQRNRGGGHPKRTSGPNGEGKMRAVCIREERGGCKRGGMIIRLRKKGVKRSKSFRNDKTVTPGEAKRCSGRMRRSMRRNRGQEKLLYNEF